MTALTTLLSAVRDGDLLSAQHFAQALEVPLNSHSITSPESVWRSEIALSGEPQEIVVIYALTRRNRIIARVELFRGGLTSSIVDLKVVFRKLLELAADSFILLHNHPSGEPDPSSEDIRITQEIAHAGRLLSLPLRDHIIISLSGHFSFLESGLIPNV